MSNSTKNDRNDYIIEALTVNECRQEIVNWIRHTSEQFNKQRKIATDKRVKNMLRMRVEAYDEMANFIQRFEIRKRDYTDIKQRSGVDKEDDIE